MQIEVIRPFRGYQPGQRFDWPDGMANDLIRRGVIKAVEEEAKSVDAAPANKMIASPARKKGMVAIG